jgi:hypothetical protein
LDVSTGRIYISRDVIFDENVTPFATLHPNARACLRAEVELLPSNLYEGDHEGVCTVGKTAKNADSSNPTVERLFVENIHEKQGEIGVQKHVVSGCGATAPGTRHEVDSSAVIASALDPALQLQVPGAATRFAYFVLPMQQRAWHGISLRVSIQDGWLQIFCACA